jgi:hypothetical protein
MPIYLYQHPETEEIVEILQSMNEPHVYERNGVQYKRIFTKPNAGIMTAIDPNSKSQFFTKLDSGKFTMGDAFDMSKEMSEKRAEKTGQDVVKEKFYSDWSKKRNGKVHPQKEKEVTAKKLKDMGISVSN